MVKKIRLSIIALAAITTFSSYAQTTVTIGSGTSSGTSAPVASWYNSSATESIYTNTEIGTTGYITTLAYQKMSGNSSAPISVQIYIKTTTESFIPSGNYSIGTNFTNYTLVYDGQLPNNGTGWMQVALQSPFAYTDGSRNLSILIVGSTCIESGRPQFSYTSASGNRMSAYYTDGSIGCGGNAPFNNTVTMRPVWERPNLRLTISPTLDNENLSTSKNKVVAFSSNSGLTVSSSLAVLKNIAIYNVQGRLLYTINTNNKEVVLQGFEATNQLLMVKATDANNHTTTIKTLY